MLETALQQIITDFCERRGFVLNDVQIDAPDCWQLKVTFNMSDMGTFHIHNLRKKDLAQLHTFSAQLSPRSRELFSPYPWDNTRQCDQAFRTAITQSTAHTDASYLLTHDGLPIGHFFLWNAGGNPISQQFGLEVPELGVAIADAYQGQGFGSLTVRLLQAVAESLHADGIELTTALDNDAGWQTYLRAGFEYDGILRIPLGVNVTAVEQGAMTAENYRDERHLFYCLRTEKHEAIKHYLAQKRANVMSV